MNDMTPLTIVNDINRSTGTENGENAGVIKDSSACGAILDLEAELKT